MLSKRVTQAQCAELGDWEENTGGRNDTIPDTLLGVAVQFPSGFVKEPFREVGVGSCWGLEGS